ncbi:ribonuclease III domain-containing protein [Russula compacta]|nr:ribonuclease III domain-containing protein [Russula compacta]
MSGLPSPRVSPSRLSVAAAKPPPLPEIRSERIRKRIFTHSSLAIGHRYDFQAPESDSSTDNEELAHIGDQVFGLAITDLIQGLYPHLQVGPASKVRDYIKRKCVLAQICVSYGLHKKLNLLERQASRLRASQSVQVNVFKAYVGGVYRDRGLEVVSKWLTSLFRTHVEAAYQIVREEHLLPPAATAVSQPMASIARHPSPSSSMSEGAEPASPSHPTGDTYDPCRRTQPRDNFAEQGSGLADGDDGGPKVIDQPSFQYDVALDSRCVDDTTPQRRSSAHTNTTERVEKWPRS